jgi:hydrogenase nickel incorporation protein HypA/HybF
MHELGVAHEILSLVQQHVPAADAARVTAVRVRVGDLAGIVVPSLDFCFGAIVAGTPWERARLVVERVPAQAACLDCAHVFATEAPGAGCPGCGSARVRMTAGRELHVDAVDLADETGGAPTPPGVDTAQEALPV